MLIYTDGSVRQEVGGWAWIEVEDGKVIRGQSGRTTEAMSSNRLELLAVIQALMSTDEDEDIEIRTDSQSVIRAYEQGQVDAWRIFGWITLRGKPVANQDLWEIFLKLIARRTITFSWVKGHAGDPFNELVDKLANADNYHETLPVVQMEERPQESTRHKAVLAPTIVSDPAFPDNDRITLPIGSPTQALIILPKEQHERLLTYIRAMSIADPTWRPVVQNLKSVVYL